MAEAFQFGAQRDVVVNLPVKDDSGVAIFGKDGLIAMVQVDDFQARRAQREQMRLKHALLVGTAVNQCGRGLPDSFRRRAPVFSGKPGDSAQLPAPSFSRESFARCHLALEKNSPIAVYLVYQSYRNRRLREVARFAASAPTPDIGVAAESVRDRGERAHQRAGAIPHDLHANANQQKGAEPQHDAHAAFTNHGSQTVGKGVANINTDGYKRGANHGGKTGKQISFQGMRQVCAERDGDGDRTRADDKGQGQRIKRVPKNILQIHFFLDVAGPVPFLFFVQHGPTVGNDHQTAAKLHDGNRDAEEVQDVRADHERRNEENKTVHGHLARKSAARWRRVAARERKKNGAAAERIDDRKERAQDQQYVLGRFEHLIAPRRRV